MPTVKYTANLDPLDGTTRLGPIWLNGEPTGEFLELGGEGKEADQEWVDKASQRFVLDTGLTPKAEIPGDAEIIADPGAHSVDIVTGAFERISDEEVRAVKAMEKEGKQRKGILEWERPAPAPDPDATEPDGDHTPEAEVTTEGVS